MEKNIILSPISIDELNELIRKTVQQSNEELISKVVEKIPQEEVFTFEEIAAYIKRKGVAARRAIIGFGIQPHSYDEDANPLYLKSEVISKIKLGSAPHWYEQGRKSFLEKTVGQSIFQEHKKGIV